MAHDYSHLRIVRNADGAVLLDLKHGKITTLNSTGAFVWDALQRSEDPRQIATHLASETDQHIELLERDVEQFIASLTAQKLLVG